MLATLLLFISVFVNQPVSAKSTSGRWPMASQRLVSDQNALAPAWDRITDPYLMSIVDHARLRYGGWGQLASGSRLLTVLTASPEFQFPEGGSAGLGIRLWNDGGNRPLVVYLPGIFQGAADEDTSRVVYTMREAGYQVAVIPNPLSAEYFENYPVAPTNALAREAQIVFDAIAELRARTNQSQVRLVAASYGAALGARVWAMDQAAPAPGLDDLTLLFPQFDLTPTMDIVDAAITAPWSQSPARSAIGRLYSTSLGKLVKRLRLRYREDLAAGFKARRYSEVATASLITRSDPKRLRLRDVLDHYVADPEATRTYGTEQTSLNYWLDQAYKSRGRAAVRILTSEDDWTNAPGVWAQVPSFVSGPEHLLILNHAGHAAVVAQEWFRLIMLHGMKVN